MDDQNLMNNVGGTPTGTASLEDGASAAAIPGQDPELESHPLDAVVDDILSQYLDKKIDGNEAAKRFKQALALYPCDTEEEESSATPKPGEGDEDEGEESAHCEESATKPVKPAPGGKCSWKQAMQVLEKAGAPVTAVNVEAVRHLESAADRDALAANLKGAGGKPATAATPTAKPRSGDGRTKPDSLPARGTESAATDNKATRPAYDPAKARAALHGRG